VTSKRRAAPWPMQGLMQVLPSYLHNRIILVDLMRWMELVGEMVTSNCARRSDRPLGASVLEIQHFIRKRTTNAAGRSTAVKVTSKRRAAPWPMQGIMQVLPSYLHNRLILVDLMRWMELVGEMVTSNCARRSDRPLGASVLEMRLRLRHELSEGAARPRGCQIGRTAPELCSGLCTVLWKRLRN
jgi:hypothetical protein